MKKTAQLIKKFKLLELLAIAMLIVILIMYAANNWVARQDSSSDLQRRKNLDTAQYGLNLFFANNGYFPALEDYQDRDWRRENSLLPEDASENHSYETTLKDRECIESKQQCAGYTLSTTFSNDTVYILQSPSTQSE